MNNNSDSDIKPGDLVEFINSRGQDVTPPWYRVAYNPGLPLDILWMTTRNHYGFPLPNGVFVRATEHYVVLLHPDHGFVIGLFPPHFRLRKLTEDKTP